MHRARAGGRAPQEQAVLEILELAALPRSRRHRRVQLIDHRVAPASLRAGAAEVLQDLPPDGERAGTRVPQHHPAVELLPAAAALRVRLFQHGHPQVAAHPAHGVVLAADLAVGQHLAARDVVAVVVARLVVAPAAQVIGRDPLAGRPHVQVGLQPPVVELRSRALPAAPGLAVHVVGSLVQGAALAAAGGRGEARRRGPGVHPVGGRGGRRRSAVVDHVVERGPREVAPRVIAVLIAGEHAVRLDAHAVGHHVPVLVARPLPGRGAVHRPPRADAAHQPRRGVEHRRRPVVGVGRAPVMLDADRVVVVGIGMPRHVRLAHHLGDLAVGFADHVVRRHVRGRVLEPRDRARVVALHRMHDHRRHRVAGGAVVA